MPAVRRSKRKAAQETEEEPPTKKPVSRKKGKKNDEPQDPPSEPVVAEEAATEEIVDNTEHVAETTPNEGNEVVKEETPVQEPPVDEASPEVLKDESANEDVSTPEESKPEPNDPPKESKEEEKDISAEEKEEATDSLAVVIDRTGADPVFEETAELENTTAPIDAQSNNNNNGNADPRLAPDSDPSPAATATATDASDVVPTEQAEERVEQPMDQEATINTVSPDVLPPPAAEGTTAHPLVLVNAEEATEERAEMPTSVAGKGTTTYPSRVASGEESVEERVEIPPSVQANGTTTQPLAVANAEEIVEERTEIPASVVGKVIGKGGEQIRDLQARSGARIDVDQTVPPGHARVITYKGTRNTVDYAKMLVSMLAQEGVTENDLPLGLAKREILIVPSQSVGKIIGQRGMVIRDLQVKSEAKIQIDHSGTSGVPQDKKQISVIGSEHAVVKAKEMIMFIVVNPLIDALQSMSMLIEEKLSGRSTWGSGPPYPSMPNQGYNMTVEMVGAGTGGGYPSAYTGGSGGYQTAAPGAYGQQAQPAYQSQQAAYQAPQQTHQAGFNQFGGGVETDVIYEPKPYMGRIIGQRGITVNDLQRRSGCDIQINQHNAVGPNCEITIRGPRQGIEDAKRMIREIIEVGPAHPYAGGAEAGFGRGGPVGGGEGGGYYQQQQGYDQSYSYQNQGYGNQGFAQQRPSQQYGQQSAYGQQAAGAYGHAQHAGQSQYYGNAAPAAYQPPVPQQNLAVSAWKSAASPDGQVYYYNEQTGATQWEKPPGFA